MDSLAPVIIFLYNRPDHSKLCLESLKTNDLIKHTELHIYIDGPKIDAKPEELQRIEEVKSLASSVNWSKKLTIHVSEVNRGLDDFLPIVMDEVFINYDRAIVLEDDLILSSKFLTYMNSALDIYADEDRVMHISGYMFPSNKKLDQTFLVQSAPSWGWGTWKSAWSNFNPDAKALYDQVKKVDLHRYDLDSSFDAVALLKRCADGIKNHWDARWYASLYLNDGLALLPGETLVRNIGFDGTGMNCNENYLTRVLHSQPISENIQVNKLPISESASGRKAVASFCKKLTQPSLRIKIAEKIRQITR